MGPCVSRSSASTAAAEPAHASTATVVDMDGAMARFAAPVTAHEALAAAAVGRASSSSYFLCRADELDFDAPARAMGAGDTLRAGEIYFALPLSMLRRPLSGRDMAALAVKAIAALGAAPVDVVVDAGRAGVSSRGKSAAGETWQRQRRAGRVAPLLGVVTGDDGSVHGGDGGYGDARRAAAYGGDRTVGKTRNGAGYRGAARAAVPVERLSVLVEADSE